MKKIKIDWLKAKREFLLDYSMSLKDIADKYGFSYSKIKKVSASREWHKDKKRIQNFISDALMTEVENNIEEQFQELTKEIKPSLGEKAQKAIDRMYKQVAKLTVPYEP
jgi:uncharacterized protein YjcR